MGEGIAGVGMEEETGRWRGVKGLEVEGESWEEERKGREREEGEDKG